MFLILSPGMSRMTSRIVCDHRIILVYVNRTKTMEERLAKQCADQNMLLAPITLPNVEVRVGEWKNMTTSQQGTEVFSQLNHFLNVTHNVKAPECFYTELKKLTHSVYEIKGLVNKAWRYANNSTPITPEVNPVSQDVISNNSTDIMDIFQRFSKLLRGKVTFLMQALREGNCR
ncbi:thrombopoietin isoform X2 [Hyperolius riggenbachi]